MVETSDVDVYGEQRVLVPPPSAVSDGVAQVLAQLPKFFDQYRRFEAQLVFTLWKHPSLDGMPNEPFDMFLRHLLTMVVIGDYGLLKRLHHEVYPHVLPDQLHLYAPQWRQDMLAYGSYAEWAQQVVMYDMLFDLVDPKLHAVVLDTVKCMVWYMVHDLNEVGLFLQA